MGSSSKKKQRRKKDFQKTKLKVGKKIPKGNVVDTTFKTRKIQIRDQQKGRVDSLTGNAIRKNIEEICKQLKTQNPHRRTDALRGLKESLLAFPDTLLTKLYVVVPQLAATLTDECWEVRRDALPVLRHVFSRVPFARAQPFLPILSAHLRCAINHLSQDVQHDSLLFLDLLIELYPEYVVHLKALIDDFLRLISKPRQSALVSGQLASDRLNLNPGPTSISKTFGVTLTSDPSRRLTSAAWHLRVAQRMQKILGALLENAECHERSSSSSSKRPPMISSDQPGLWPDLSVSSNHLETFFESAEHLQSFYSNIMPLLLEMWVEAGTIAANVPNKKTPPCDKMQFYSCIVVIIKMLLRLLDTWADVKKGRMGSQLHQWFRDTFGRAFISHCMGGFPYSEINQQRKAKNAQPNAPKAMSAVMLNLNLCDIATTIFATNAVGDIDDCLGPPVYFVRTLLDSDNKRLVTNHENVESALGVVHRVLCMPDLSETTQADLLDSFIGQFEKTPAGTKVHRFYLKILRDIVLTRKNIVFRKRLMEAWIVRFGNDLLQGDVIPWECLEIIKQMGGLGHMEFLNKMQDLYPELLERLPVLPLEPGRSTQEARKLIINYVYVLPLLNKSVLSVLARLCNDHKLDLSSCLYGMDLLTIRCLNDRPNGRYQKTCDCFLSFILSVTFGCSADYLGALQTLDNFERCNISFPNRFEFKVDSPEDLQFHSRLTKNGVENLTAAFLSGLSDSLVANFLNDLLTAYKVFPLRCLYSILAIVSYVWKTRPIPTFLLPPLLDMFTFFLELGVEQGQTSSDFKDKVAGLMNVDCLSDHIVKRLLTVAYGVLSPESRLLLENMVSSVLVSCQEKEAKALEQILTFLQHVTRLIQRNVVCPKSVVQRKPLLDPALQSVR